MSSKAHKNLGGRMKDIEQLLAACRRDFPANPICGTLWTCSEKLLIAGRNAHGPQIQKG
jgi:hypothetical protein